MSKYFNITVDQVNRETPDAVSIRLDIPEELHEEFRFKAGQHLAFKHVLNGEELRRNYSLCSVPEEGWKIAIKKIEGGRFSTFANTDLKAGDVLQVMPPTGHFTLSFNPDHENYYVAFAAGSGITPVISLIKATLSIEPKSKFLLIYGNKRQETILFKKELFDLKNQFVERFSFFHVLSEEKLGSILQEGRIDTDKCNVFARTLFQPSEVDKFLLCGPEDMIFSVQEELLKLNVPESKIKFELFTTEGLKRRKAKVVENGKKIDKLKSAIEIKMDGNRFSFDFRLYR